MENNNQDLNNQVNENTIQPEVNETVNVDNNQPPIVNDNIVPPVETPEPVNNNPVEVHNNDQLIPSKKNNNVLVILLVLIILGVAGYFGYTKFIAKEEPKGNGNPTPTPLVTTTPEPTNTATTKIIDYNPEDYKFVVNDKLTYKTKDGKKEITFVLGNNSEYKDKIKSYEMYNEDDLFAIYEGKMYGIWENHKVGKYVYLTADDIGNMSQCGTYKFIINMETNELLDLDPSKGSFITKINDKYYIMDSACVSGIKAVYTEDYQKIGTNYLGYDENYFYILNDNIVKYDANGNIVAKSNDVYKADDSSEYYDSIKYNDVLYIVLNDKKDIYFVDTRDLSRTKIGTMDKYNFGGMDFHCLKEENGKIIVTLYELNTDDSQNNNEKEYKFTYDPVSKTLS